MSNDQQQNKKSVAYCSFCNKSQFEVQKIVLGASACICDECVELCRDIIKSGMSNFEKSRVYRPLCRDEIPFVEGEIQLNGAPLKALTVIDEITVSDEMTLGEFLEKLRPAIFSICREDILDQINTELKEISHKLTVVEKRLFEMAESKEAALVILGLTSALNEQNKLSDDIQTELKETVRKKSELLEHVSPMIVIESIRKAEKNKKHLMAQKRYLEQYKLLVEINNK